MRVPAPSLSFSFSSSSPSSFFCRRLTNSPEPDCFLMRLPLSLSGQTPFPLLPLLFVFTDDVGDGVERSFFRLGTPLRGESRDQEEDGRGPTTAGRLQLHSKFFPRSITNGSFQQGTFRCLSPPLSIPQISFPRWMMGRTFP